jgi:hypothetical protein
MRLLYRLSQFWEALVAKPTASGLALAQSILYGPLLELFLRLQPSEQAHSLRIACLLIGQNEDNPDLLVAALLHDVGKCRFPLRVWERVLIVLGKALFPEQARKWGKGHPYGWRRPFVVAEQHPDWGAEMAAQAGASALTVSLVRNHQEHLSVHSVSSEPDKTEALLLQRLQRLDNKS